MVIRKKDADKLQKRQEKIKIAEEALRLERALDYVILHTKPGINPRLPLIQGNVYNYFEGAVDVVKALYEQNGWKIEFVKEARSSRTYMVLS